MKSGVSFFSFDERVCLKEAMNECSRAGFEGIELVLGCEGEICPGTTERELISYKKMAENQGLKIISIGAANVWEHNLVSDVEKERTLAKDNIRRQIEIAGIMGADTALVVPGWVGTPFAAGTIAYDRAYDRAQEGLSKLAGEAQAAGITIAIENVWNRFLLSPLEMKRFLDEINSDWVGAYFDIGNIIYIGYPEQWIRILASRIKRLQFCDCRGEQSGLGMFVDLFEGDVNFPAVMEAVKEIGYDGWAVLEVFPNYRSFPFQAVINGKLSLDRILKL